MRRFDLLLPNTVDECLKILAERGPETKLLAGGTDLLPQMKNGVLKPAVVVDLSGIARVRQVDNGNGLRIGAAVTARELEVSPALRGAYAAIAESAALVGSLQVRNLATVGGNLCNAAPSADMAPPLVALEALAVIAGPKGERTSSVESLYRGYLETTLQPGELITQVQIPSLAKKRAVYLKCTTRSADDWPALGVAVVLDGDRPTIVVSAATDKPTRLASVEAAEALQIEDDLHGSGEYKKQLLRVYLKRAMNEARNAGH